ncbi:hypothetical protein HK096_006629 [Nowakowskiella sp. JEL0078]|nr:hypothetical protein HK096_006629 [Nowakowskiella sp. JEL0078]
MNLSKIFRFIVPKPPIAQSSFTPSTFSMHIRAQSRLFSSFVNHHQQTAVDFIDVLGKSYPRDNLTNIPSSVLSKLTVHLHRQSSHPLQILKSRIVSILQKLHPNTFEEKDSLYPVVTPTQNFDSLLIPSDHPGRSPSDTYYINNDFLLRTHTSAHQTTILESGSSNGYLLTADVYRRDEVNRTHYPVFHQMEGMLLFESLDGVKEKVDSLTLGGVEDANGGDYQVAHKAEDAEIVGAHLRRTLEHVMRELFRDENLKVRWIMGSFPFTAPSWEMEVWFNDQWLELCGCGVIRQEILESSGQKGKIGWAFGLGLERIAMVLFGIPDIRLFWSTDSRFLGQFKSGQIVKFQPYSRYPVCYKDVSFWCPGEFHDNDLCDIVREVAGDVAEDVSLVSISNSG